MRKFKAVYAKQYQKQDGSNGTSWKQLGFANEITNQEGKTTIHLSLDSIPTGAWDGEIKLFLQDENQNNGQNNQQQGSYNGNQSQGQQSYQQPQQQGQQQYQAPQPQYVDKDGKPIPQPQ